MWAEILQKTWKENQSRGSTLRHAQTDLGFAVQFIVESPSRQWRQIILKVWGGGGGGK